jgi:hypothetical protein
VIHDLGHDGRNNAFNVNSQDTLALTYNDKSVLENHHLATAFRLIADDEKANFLSDLLKEQVAIVRKQMIEMVLGTDMSQHFSRVGDFAGLVTKLGTEPDAWNNDEAAMSVLRCTVLHLADISNPAKPFRYACQWSARLLQEFFAQGDTEKSLGLPLSPLCDREATDIAGSQIGFIEFIVFPSYESLSSLAPRASDEGSSEIKRNKAAWESQKHDLQLTHFERFVTQAAPAIAEEAHLEFMATEEPPVPPPLGKCRFREALRSIGRGASFGNLGTEEGEDGDSNQSDNERNGNCCTENSLEYMCTSGKPSTSESCCFNGGNGKAIVSM